MNEKPQFTYEGLYISPFTARRRYDEDGRVSYLPIGRNHQPTGVRLIAGFAARLSGGNVSREYQCSATERRRALRKKGDVGRFRL